MFTQCLPPESWAQLHCDHWKSVSTIAYGILRHHQDAENAASEALIKAWRGSHQFRGRCPYPLWLRRVAVNEAFKQAIHRARCKKRRDATASRYIDELPDGRPSPDKQLELEERGLALSAAFESLSSEEQQIYHRRVEHEKECICGKPRRKCGKCRYQESLLTRKLILKLSETSYFEYEIAKSRIDGKKQKLKSAKELA